MLNHRLYTGLIVVIICVACYGIFTVQSISAQPFNVVVMLADDLGAHDLGIDGSVWHETPHLDALAHRGVRFTCGYSACTVCSPSRAGLLTGRHPARLHLTDWIAGHDRPDAPLSPPNWTKQLVLGEITIAELLHASGYATASIGKWHLGDLPEFGPLKQGFDCNRGGTHRGQPPNYFAPYKISTLSDGPEGEYLTDREASESVRFIQENQNSPFFLYVPFHAVHSPIQAKPNRIGEFKAKAAGARTQSTPAYAAMLSSLDDAVGRIVDALDDCKIFDSTLVIFTSDNGGLQGVTSNAPLRVGKGSAYEGGVRVPFIVAGQGISAPGRVCHEPVTGLDIFPTIAEVVGIPLPRESVLDGKSLVPILARPDAHLEKRDLFWHYPHYHPGGATPYSAIRRDRWRLIEFFEDNRIELYDIESDPGESKECSDREGDTTAAMAQSLIEWRKEVGAQQPIRKP